MSCLVLLLFFITSVISGCASSVGGANAGFGVAIAQQKDIYSCEFVSDVHGVSSFYGVFAAPALTSARKAALQRAAEIGATHVVWSQTDTTYGSTGVSGNAYKCE